MANQLLRLLLHPYPLRTATLGAMRKFDLGSYERRVQLGAVQRPHYGYCVWNAALLARRLGVPKISVIEFGVAGGNGLVSLEQHALATTEALGVGIEIYGFDTGQGLPEPIDFRDLPYHWKSGFFAMDTEALRNRLDFAQLVLGEVSETLPTFTDYFDPAPIGVVIQDFDYYSSTVTALQLFDVDERFRMPRIYSYFDDIIGSEVELYNDFTGERLAIAEFNAEHETQKISKAYHLLAKRVVEPWAHQIFSVHDFAHSRYNEFMSDEGQQLPLFG